MITKKHTAWKKNRKFGDVYGGRTFPICVDKIFNRQHNFSPPQENDERPIFVVENTSKYFYFPVSVDDIKTVFKKLPEEQTKHITHVWLQKIKKADYENGDTLQACFICGSGVNLIVIHPFPVDNRMLLGDKKPEKKVLNYYKNYTTDLFVENGNWYIQWNRENIRQYYLECLLLYEIGNSIDSFHKRFWSKSNGTKSKNFANSFVSLWSANVREIYKKID